MRYEIKKKRAIGNLVRGSICIGTERDGHVSIIVSTTFYVGGNLFGRMFLKGNDWEPGGYRGQKRSFGLGVLLPRLRSNWLPSAAENHIKIK